MSGTRSYGSVKYPVFRHDLARIARKLGHDSEAGNRAFASAYRRLRRKKYQMVKRQESGWPVLYCPEGWCGGDECRQWLNHVIDELSLLELSGDHPSHGPVMSRIMAYFRKSVAAKQGWETRRLTHWLRSEAAKKGWETRRAELAFAGRSRAAKRARRTRRAA